MPRLVCSLSQAQITLIVTMLYFQLAGRITDSYSGAFISTTIYTHLQDHMTHEASLGTSALNH